MHTCKPYIVQSRGGHWGLRRCSVAYFFVQCFSEQNLTLWCCGDLKPCTSILILCFSIYNVRWNKIICGVVVSCLTLGRTKFNLYVNSAASSQKHIPLWPFVDLCLKTYSIMTFCWPLLKICFQFLTKFSKILSSLSLISFNCHFQTRGEGEDMWQIR